MDRQPANAPANALDGALVARCANCGVPASYDIRLQTFCCPHCGHATAADQAADDARWRRLDLRDRALRELAESQIMSCPGCGSHVLMPKGAATAACDACGGTLVSKEFAAADLPEVILPFVLTPDEARGRLRQWAAANRRKKEAARVLSNLHTLQGYYLPYRLVRGPMSLKATRENFVNAKEYNLRGFVDKVAVSMSKDLDNNLLNDMEPFDWSALRAFELGYVGGHKVRLTDLANSKIKSRMMREIRDDYQPVLGRIFHSRDVKISVTAGDPLLSVSALLPVFVVGGQGRAVVAVVNGQTGKVAVKSSREYALSLRWLAAPVAITLGLAALAWAALGQAYVVILAPFVALVSFLAFYEFRNNALFRKALTSGASRARRQSGRLLVEPGAQGDRLPSPVFYEKNARGDEVPVEVRFMTAARLAQMLTHAAFLAAAPAILSIAIRAVQYLLGSVESVTGQIYFSMGLVWYIVGGFMCFMYCIRAVSAAYMFPIFKEIRPDGSKRPFGRWLPAPVTFLGITILSADDKKPRRKIIFWMYLAAVFFTWMMLSYEPS